MIIRCRANLSEASDQTLRLYSTLDVLYASIGLKYLCPEANPFSKFCIGPILVYNAITAGTDITEQICFGPKNQMTKC